MSAGRCICSRRGKPGEATEASSTDQLLSGGVGVPPQPRPSSTENCHPGCVMEIADERRGFLFSHERAAEMRPCEDAGMKETGKKCISPPANHDKKPSSEINVIHAHMQQADVYV